MMKVTEHALIRYMERFMGLDVEEMKKHILEQLPETTIGEVKIPIENGGCVALVRDGDVVTIMTKRKRKRLRI